MIDSFSPASTSSATETTDPLQQFSMPTPEDSSIEERRIQNDEMVDDESDSGETGSGSNEEE